ncbi:egt [Matsumuraeses phaseoli granulovirus]|uniref:Ecdysteroid UDP-glucosyltransferase n=1 Tax=Matsumuraeses phaseoli granulovirus TaxID=2760664 RepID=A0AAE7SYA8_9BBAC|nr:egt [Matsumuraeses phaseoli granulovirus]QOD40090.1 egt [Matsumuraeses phaseoli granulovirus]
MHRVILAALLAFNTALGANILCVFPTPSYSHQNVFAAYVDMLTLDGHNVTVIGPFARNAPHVTEIVSNLSADHFAELLQKSISTKKLGVVADETTVTATNYVSLIDLVERQFTSTNVNNFIAHKEDNRYDLVVCEAYLAMNLIFGYLFQAPVIQLSSGHGTRENFEQMNKGVMYDVDVYPNMWRSNFESNTSEHTLAREWKQLEIVQEMRLKSMYGNNIPSMTKLKQNVVMMFVNVPAIMDNNRPVSANVQYLGGLHLKPANTIHDQQLNEFINRKSTVVYVSFGSIVECTSMTYETLAELLRVFQALPYNVLWRVDDSIHLMFNISSNIMTRNWFNQRDILDHDNVKLFVTQGGVQSVDEALDSGVPMVGIPMMGDQFLNVRRLVQLGVAQSVDLLKLKKEKMLKKIVNIVNNQSYYDRVLNLRTYIRTISVNSARKVLWHTNKILRYHTLLSTYNKKL